MFKKLLASGVALAALSGAAQAADKKLVISVYGFAQDAFKEIVYDPFEAQCGCELVVTLPIEQRLNERSKKRWRWQQG